MVSEVKVSIKSISYVHNARNLSDLVDCRLKDGNLEDRTGTWKQGSDDSQLGWWKAFQTGR